MSEKVDTGLQSIMQVRVGLVSDYCGAKEKLDADALICALAVENATLRAENERLRSTTPEATALVEALRPFAESAMHLHPATPNEATTLDGIEVGQWRAAYVALTAWEAVQ